MPTYDYAVEASRPQLGLLASAAFTLAIAVLTLAILGIVFGRGPRRVFWTGFALFGWAYLLAVFGPTPINVREHLVTQRLLDHMPVKRWPNAVERQISRRLDEHTTVDFNEVPLQEITEFWHKSTGANFVINRYALEEEGVNKDTPMSLRVQEIPLKSALKLLLNQYNLTYLIEDDVLQITSQLDAENLSSSSWEFQQASHGLLTLLIASAGGCWTWISFAGHPWMKPQFSIRLLLALPVICAILFGFARMFDGSAAVVALCFAAGLILPWCVLVLRARTRPANSSGVSSAGTPCRRTDPDS